MSTNQEIIDSALQELGVIEAGDSANATDSATVLNTLNNMMESWEADDKDFNWFPQDTLSDTAPLPRWALEGVISNLAIMVAPNFRSPVTADLARKADKGERTILTRLINLKLEGSDMSHLGAGNARYNITTDS